MFCCNFYVMLWVIISKSRCYKRSGWWQMCHLSKTSTTRDLPDKTRNPSKFWWFSEKFVERNDFRPIRALTRLLLHYCSRTSASSSLSWWSLVQPPTGSLVLLRCHSRRTTVDLKETDPGSSETDQSVVCTRGVLHLQSQRTNKWNWRRRF